MLAVQEALSPNGVFTKVAAGAGIHPNLGTAKRVLSDGVVPIEKVEFLKTVRDLTAIEYEALGTFDYPGFTLTRFSRIFVVPHISLAILTFGPYLVIDEKTLQSPYIEMILAHELAHLNNGDSYVRAALYFLGKGFFGEYMTPYGLPQETDRQKLARLERDASDFTQAALRGSMRATGFDFKGGLMGMGLAYSAKLITGIGSGVRNSDAQIVQFFRKWDLKADALAKQWVGEEVYSEYLRSLPEREDAYTPFDASPITRKLAQPQETVIPEAEVKPIVPLWKGSLKVALIVIGLLWLMGVGLVGLVLLSAAFQ